MQIIGFCNKGTIYKNFEKLQVKFTISKSK